MGALSVVKEIWQEPPPCTAEPVNDSVWGDPMAIVLAVAGGGEVIFLQGKSEPSAAKGEEFFQIVSTRTNHTIRGVLTGLPKGAGVFIIMCWREGDENAVRKTAASRAVEKRML